MKKSSLIFAVAAALLGSASSAFAHQTYNVGTLNAIPQASATGWTYQVSAGYGNGVDGAINSSQGGAPIDNAALIWRSGVGAVSPEYVGNLPEMWYSGLHNTSTGVTRREIGTVSDPGGTPGGTGSNGGTTFITPGSSLDARIVTWNAGSGIVAQGIGLDPNSQIAVKPGSWNTGDGLDYGVTHVSCGSTGNLAANCLAGGRDLEIGWVLKNLNTASTSLLGIAIYGGFDTSAFSDRTQALGAGGVAAQTNLQGSSLGTSNLLFWATQTTPSDVLKYIRVFDAAEAALYNGEYTVVIGELSGTGDGQYYLRNTSAAPLPATLWLFGLGAAAMGVTRRRPAKAA